MAVFCNHQLYHGYLHSQIGYERLDSLAILHVYRDVNVKLH